jgi:hypothetical protein
MNRNALMAGLMLAGVCGAAPSWAEDTAKTPAPTTPPPLEQGAKEMGTAARGMVERPEQFFSQHNLTVSGGGGFSDITSTGTDGLLGVGGSWTLRGVFGADRALAVEGAYVGAAYPITARNGDAGTILSNGFEVLGRVGYPVRHNLAYVIPYLTTGLGMTLYDSTGLNNFATGVEESDVVFHIPAGGGISAGYDRLNLDLRLLYRAGFGSTMFDAASTRVGGGGASSVSLTAMAGYRF